MTQLEQTIIELHNDRINLIQELAECREKNLWLVNQNLKHRTFLNALRIKHDLDIPEEVWSDLFADYPIT